MRTVQYIHAHVLDRIIPREAARRRGVGQHVEQLERRAPAVQLVACVPGEVEAKGPTYMYDDGIYV